MCVYKTSINDILIQVQSRVKERERILLHNGEVLQLFMWVVSFVILFSSSMVYLVTLQHDTPGVMC